MDWGLLIHDLVTKMVKSLPTTKGTPLSSYLAHLYHHFELLQEDEMVSWEAQEQIWRYGDKDSEQETDNPDPENPELSQEGPPQEIMTRTVSFERTSRKIPEDSSERQVRTRTDEPGSSRMVFSTDPADRILEAVEELREEIRTQEQMLDAISAQVGCTDRSKLLESVSIASEGPTRIEELGRRI